MSDGRLLAVDCSMRITGMALSEGGRSVASESLDLGRRQSAELPLMAERLLSGAGWSWNDIGLVAVTNGPGYFTGIRVGAAWASALAYGLGVRLILVSSLRLLAGASGNEGGTLAVVYAGRHTVYAASFGHDGPLEQGEYTGPEIAAWLGGRNGVSVVSDDAVRASAALTGTSPGEGGGFAFPIREVRPDAAVLAGMAWRERDRAVQAMELRVAYCRSPLYN